MTISLNRAFVLNCLLVASLSLGFSSLAKAQTTLYLNTFDDASALNDFTLDGTVEVSGGQMVSPLVNGGGVILDLTTVTDYITTLDNYSGKVIFGFNVSVEDTGMLNGGFEFLLSSTTDDPISLGSVGYGVRGGTMVNDRTTFSYFNSTQGLQNVLIDEPNGVPDQPSMGTVKLVYDTITGLWEMFIRVDTVFHDPLSLDDTYKRGEAINRNYTDQELPYLIFGRAGTDTIYFDNVSISVIDFELLPPAGLTVSGTEITSGINLVWPDEEFADSYRIYRNIIDDFGSASLIDTVTELTYSDTTTSPGELYYYWVKSVRNSTESDMAASGSGTRGLGSVTGVVASKGEFSESVYLEWDENPGSQVYRIFRGTTGVFGDAVEIANVASLYYSDDTATNEVEYFYWVVAESGLATASPSVAAVGRAANFQPDLSIAARRGPLKGAGLVNPTGAGQVARAKVKRRRKIKGTLFVNSIGALSERIMVRGTRGNRRIDVAYRLGGNVTGSVVSGRLTVAANSPVRSIKIKMTPDRKFKKSRRKLRMNLLIRGNSAFQPAIGDAVKFKAISFPK